ncbi:type 1 fimbrial protein [Rahnella bruchi]|uniref:type 1 fimbrial protein n=1 Tax=Rahnella bruchi TaxID=1510573 RepID=UPI000EA025EE|nr:type 1 fimbrial protein [Rahnella bruchi]
MNKQTLGILVASVLASASVTAAPVANLKINGDIKPPTCTVNGGDQADLVYNLGAVSPSVIPQSKGYNGLPALSNKLTVTCDAATYLTFKATDTYQNPLIQAPWMAPNLKTINFNLVDANSPEKTVGGVSYVWTKPTADGKTVSISRANDGVEDDGVWAGATIMVKDATNGWTTNQQKYVAPAELELVSAKVFSANIVNSAVTHSGLQDTYLLSKDELVKQGVDLSEGLDYTGNTMLTFNFGV